MKYEVSDDRKRERQAVMRLLAEIAKRACSDREQSIRHAVMCLVDLIEIGAHLAYDETQRGDERHEDRIALIDARYKIMTIGVRQ